MPVTASRDCGGHCETGEFLGRATRLHGIGMRCVVGAARIDILRRLRAVRFPVVTGRVFRSCVSTSALNRLLTNYHASQVLQPGHLLSARWNRARKVTSRCWVWRRASRLCRRRWLRARGERPVF